MNTKTKARTYWLCLFNATTWSEFLAAGGDIVGFPHTQHQTVFRIKPGDCILAYMTKAFKRLSVMEVAAAANLDTEAKI